MKKSYPKHPLVSVVIPAFNEERFVGKTLFSLSNQDFKDFEVIVVDNNSSDKTAKIAKKFGAILLFEKRQGVAFARQKGFLKAKGKIIATTDADTILPKNWLSRISEEFKKDENLVAFGGSCESYSGPILVKVAAHYLLYPFLIFDKFFSGGWNLMGSNFSVRKKSFLRIGGFKTDLKLNEDIEISHRLRKIGKVIFDPNFKVKTSGRRYRHGLIFGLINYAPSTIFRFLFKRYDKFQKLSSVRTEESLINKLSLPIFSLFLFLFFLFHFSYPSIAQAKKFEWVRKDINKVVFVEREVGKDIGKDLKILKNFHPKEKWMKKKIF